MKELLRTTDPVRLSWLTALLAGEGIHAEILDHHTSVLEGSASAIPRRLVVDDDDYDAARETLVAAGELEDEAASAQAPSEQTTSGTLLGGRVRLRQPAAGYRVAIDPVLLAAATPGCTGRVLDLGAGVGAAALCYAWRVRGAAVTALERAPALVRLGLQNVRDNGFEGRVSFVEADLLRLPDGIEAGAFEHVMANPPYMSRERGAPSGRLAKAAATFEDDAALADWVGCALSLVRPKGGVTLIHRADRLDELLGLLSGRAGGIVIVPLWPGEGRPAKRVIVRARRDVRAPTTLTQGLTLHSGGGAYTRAARRILERGGPLDP